MTASPQSAAQTDSPDANPTDPKLHRLLGGEPVAWLLQRARDRLEAGRPLTGSVTLPAATPAQRQAVERLAGRPGEAQVLLAGSHRRSASCPRAAFPSGAECCGDAHALDDGQPVGTLVLSAVRALAGLPFAAEGTADSRRAAWASAGVHLDDLSSLVLCVVLPGDTRTVVGKVLAANREAGQPTMLTLRQLRCHDEPLRAVRVWICENPVVVAATADELGGRCQPLVCVGGQPSAAGWRLLDLLAAGGAEFGYHGDFDWGGARIAEAVRRRVNWPAVISPLSTVSSHAHGEGRHVLSKKSG